MLHIIEFLQSLFSRVPSELAQHPTVAQGVGEYVAQQANDELKRLNMPYRVSVTYVGNQPAQLPTV